MSAFLAYDGEYEFNGRAYAWRCYATAPVHAVRKREHGPHPKPPEGLKWVDALDRRRSGVGLNWLMEEGAEGFSHLMAQVEASVAVQPVTGKPSRGFPRAGL